MQGEIERLPTYSEPTAEARTAFEVRERACSHELSIRIHFPEGAIGMKRQRRLMPSSNHNFSNVTFPIGYFFQSRKSKCHHSNS